MRLKENSLIEALTFFSQLCHCLETSKLLALGYVNKLPILNSFFKYLIKDTPKLRAKSLAQKQYARETCGIG
jgi:hypothetical protein